MAAKTCAFCGEKKPGVKKHILLEQTGSYKNLTLQVLKYIVQACEECLEQRRVK